jgi:hypothetical protein
MAPLLTTRLEGLRAQMRGRLFLAGALRLGAEAGAFLVLQFAADRMLDLPVAARRSVLLAATLLFAWRFIVLIGRPLGRRIVAMDMALAVERRHPELDGALASMVEFERVVEVPADVSPALLDQWRGEVEAKSGALDFSAIFDARLLKRLLLADVGLLLVIGGFVATHAAEARIFLARFFGAEVDWPRRTHLLLDVVAGDSPHFRVERDGNGRATSVLIARGASLPVDVTARGTVPDEVLLVIRESGRDGKEEVRLAPKEGAPGGFAYRFKNVVRAMELNAEGGDDPGTGTPLLVKVAPAPAVEKLIATVTPPAYTRRSPTREERQEFAVPAGTRLDLDVRTIGEVSEGTLTLHNDPGTSRALEHDASEKTLWHASLVATETGTFNLHLTARNGFRNLQLLDYPLTVLADRKPTVEVARPTVSDLEVTPRGVVPFRLLVDDDYGVTKVSLRLTRAGEKVGRTVALQGEGSPRPDPLPAVGEPTTLDSVLDLKALVLPRVKKEGATPVDEAVGEGESIGYDAVAQDNREDPPGTRAPNETQTPPRRIDVVSDGEKMRKIADRQLRVKQNVAAAKKSQEERLAGLDAILAAQGADAVETRELTALEVDQGRVVGSARQIARDLADVAQDFVLNRLDPAPAAERVLAFLIDRLQAVRARNAFDFAPYAELAAAHAKGDFGELQQLGNLIAMLDLGMQASEKDAQKALESLRGARLTARGEDRLALLKLAGDAERKVIDDYSKLLEKMEQWEDFQEILDLWRGLVRDQGEINRQSRSGAAPVAPETGK